jgi:hypothetical protein
MKPPRSTVRPALASDPPMVADRDEPITECGDALDAGREHSRAWLSRYRQRLIDAGMVRPDGRGRIAYALPYLGEHLARSGA